MSWRLPVMLVMMLWIATGCDTKNIGGNVYPPRAAVVFVTVPAGMNGGAEFPWTVTWTTSNVPFTIEMDMGGGTTADVPEGTPAVSPFAQTFTMVNPSTTEDATCTYTVIITDAYGQSGVATGTYIVGPIPNEAPSIDDISYADGVLTVTVSDRDESGALSVDVELPEGMLVDATPKDAAQVSGATATFNLGAADVFAGASGDVMVTVTDSLGATDTDTITVIIYGINQQVPAGALWAVAMSPTATVGGDPVTVVILTGDLPADAPFNYCDGVGFTINEGADYARYSYNYGAPGGAWDEMDGIWGTMSPIPTGFIWSMDMIAWTPLDDDPTMGRIDLWASPYVGSGITDVTDGAILNFGLEFSEPGVYTLGFQYFEDVRRTFYSSPDATTHEWDNLDNVNDYNQITVTE